MRAHISDWGTASLACRGLLCFQLLNFKHVPQFSNSKDSILQQSLIVLILMLSLGFREEGMNTTVKES